MTNRIKRTGTLALGLAIGVGMSAAPGPSHADDKAITVVTWGGAYQELLSNAYDADVMDATGIKVIHDEWGGERAKLRAMVDTSNYTWDVLDTQAPTVSAGCEEGFLEPIDYEALGGKSKYIDGATHECGVGSIVVGWVWTYNKDLFPGETPKTWADFWNVEKFPGKRGMWKSPQSTLEYALLADGVPADQIYDRLSTEEGQDQALAKLDEIRDHVIWWESGAQSMQLLHDKEVSMTTTWNGRAYGAIVNENRNYEIVWHNQLVEYGFWSIPKGNPRAPLVYEYLKFVAQPKYSAVVGNGLGYGPVAVGADEFMNEEVLPHLPSAPANLETAIGLSDEFWADHLEELTTKFTGWLAK